MTYVYIKCLKDNVCQIDQIYFLTPLLSFCLVAYFIGGYSCFKSQKVVWIYIILVCSNYKMCQCLTNFLLLLLLLQRQGSLSTLCDKPEWNGAVCSLWRHRGTRHSAQSGRLLQNKPHWTIWRVPDKFVFWGETKLFFWVLFLNAKGER